MRREINDTIIARASAYGSSVRSIIRMSGVNCLEVLRQFFEPVPLPKLRPYILDGNLIIWNEQQKIPSTLYYWSKGHGYTGEESAEVHTVGSPPVFEAFIDAVCKTGLVRLANAGEFTLRAFLNGRIDLTQAEAVLGVIDADSKRSLEFALQQLAGGAALPLAEIRESLFNALVQLEAGFDFADEDIEFISNDEVRQIVSNAIVAIEHLRVRLGLRGVAGERSKVALAGLPNAGKSSLFNCLLNKNFAIVSDEAGTTRDYLEAEINFGGIECVLIDTAGITDNFNVDNFKVDNNSNDNNTDKNIDVLAQNYSRKLIEIADVIIFCVDLCKAEFGEVVMCDVDFYLSNLLGEDVKDRLIVAGTKSDLLGTDWGNDLIGEVSGDFISVSSLSGEGVDELCVKIAEKLQAGRGGDNAIIGTESRCREAIHAAHNALNRAINLQIQDESLIAAEIHAAINSLGLIDGTVHTDDILDKIFERFCIGK
ncbi:MAG: tRNA modification GTPase [Planctomycetaceae bacterium]|jgi:tRNA modification GTPase|nr:tRNA modification GTPase [Planctomycetaceae bacterium]